MSEHPGGQAQRAGRNSAVERETSQDCVPAIDHAALARMFDAIGAPGRGALAAMIRGAVEQAPAHVDALDLAIRSAELGAAAEIGHRLRGGMAQLGFVALAARCAALERALAGGSAETYAEHVGAIRAELARTVEAAREALRSWD